jgi:hypothetical protein
MIKKNILNIVLLSSSILASADLVPIKTETTDKVDLNFSIDLNNPNQENAGNNTDQPKANSLYEGLTNSWHNISQKLGQIYNSDIVPLAALLQELATKLGSDTEFQKLLNNNSGKIKDSLSELFSDVKEKFASSKDLQEIFNSFQELNKNADEKIDSQYAREFAINTAGKVAESKDLQEFIKNVSEKFNSSIAPLISEIIDKAATIAGYKDENKVEEVK